MDLTFTDTEQPVDALSRVNWSELLIGPCLVVHSSSLDGTVEFLQFQSLTVDLMFRVAAGTLPPPLAELLTIASPGRLNGGS
jgi:hypothetical protein